jgi:hypothetical protein
MGLWLRRQWCVNGVFTALAGVSEPDVLEHLYLGGNHIQLFADVVAHVGQGAAATTDFLSLTKIMLNADTGKTFGDRFASGLFVGA